jgi:hypothetical protein
MSRQPRAFSDALPARVPPSTHTHTTPAVQKLPEPQRHLYSVVALGYNGRQARALRRYRPTTRACCLCAPRSARPLLSSLTCEPCLCPRPRVATPRQVQPAVHGDGAGAGGGAAQVPEGAAGWGGRAREDTCWSRSCCRAAQPLREGAWCAREAGLRTRPPRASRAPPSCLPRRGQVAERAGGEAAMRGATAAGEAWSLREARDSAGS